MQSRALTYVTMLSGDRLHGGVRSAGDDGGTRVLLLLTLTAWYYYCITFNMSRLAPALGLARRGTYNGKWTGSCVVSCTAVRGTR